MILRARFGAGDEQRRLGVGAESLEVGLFSRQRIPWDRIAFPSIRWALDAWQRGGTGPLGPLGGNPPEDQRGTRRPTAQPAAWA